MELIKQGKKMVIGIIIVMLFADIATIIYTGAIFLKYAEFDYFLLKMTQGTIRLILTGIMLFFMYKGSKIAKNIMITLLIFGGILGLISGLFTFNILSLVMTMIYLGIILVMMKSHSIKSFLSYQKEK